MNLKRIKNSKKTFKRMVKKLSSDRDVNIMESDDEREERNRLREYENNMDTVMKSIKWGSKMYEKSNRICQKLCRRCLRVKM